MNVADFLFISACALSGIVGFTNGKNAQRRKYEEEQKEKELNDLHREVMNLKATSMKNENS